MEWNIYFLCTAYNMGVFNSDNLLVFGHKMKKRLVECSRKVYMGERRQSDNN